MRHGVEKHFMKQSIALLFAASTLLLAGCCTTPHTTQWEYKVARPPLGFGGGGPKEAQDAQQTFLNDLGKDGWVLVSQMEGRVFYFKRPVK